MAITVNGELHPHREGMTVAALLDELRYTWPLKTVFVDGAVVRKADHAATVLEDGADVKVLHLMAGG